MKAEIRNDTIALTPETEFERKQIKVFETAERSTYFAVSSNVEDGELQLVIDHYDLEIALEELAQQESK